MYLVSWRHNQQIEVQITSCTSIISTIIMILSKFIHALHHFNFELKAIQIIKQLKKDNNDNILTW